MVERARQCTLSNQTAATWEPGPATVVEDPAGTIICVDVVISEPARKYIREHGGTVFVRSHPHRCCTGSLTLLDLAMTRPDDAADFQSFDTEGIGVRFCGSGGFPHQLVIELRGLFARHPVAFWDGCAFKP